MNTRPASSHIRAFHSFVWVFIRMDMIVGEYLAGTIVGTLRLFAGAGTASFFFGQPPGGPQMEGAG